MESILGTAIPNDVFPSQVNLPSANKRLACVEYEEKIR